MGQGALSLMPFQTYTQADLATRVIARLSEVGIAMVSGVSPGTVPPSADLSLEALNRRALMKLGEIGFGEGFVVVHLAFVLGGIPHGEILALACEQDIAREACCLHEMIGDGNAPFAIKA